MLLRLLRAMRAHRGPSMVGVLWVLLWLPMLINDSVGLAEAKKAKKAKKKAATQDLGPLHHRTYKPLSGSVDADGSILLSSAPKRYLTGGGGIPAETVTLPMECTVERRDDITAEEFEAEFRHRRPLIVSAPDDHDDDEHGGSSAKHFSYEAVKRRYGEEQVTLAFPQHPLPPPAIEQTDNFDANNPSIVRLGLRRMALREYMERKYTEADPLYLFARLTWQPAREHASVPEFARGSAGGKNASTFIGVGRSGSGLPFHWHQESFVEVMEGRTFWSLLSGQDSPAYNPEKTHGQWLIDEKVRGPDALSPDRKVAGRRRRQFCIQKAGEVLYIPAGYWQGTFNLEETVSIAHHAADGGPVTASESSVEQETAGAGDRIPPWWSAWSDAMRVAMTSATAAQKTQSKDPAAGAAAASAAREVVDHLRVAVQRNPGNAAVVQAYGLALFELAERQQGSSGADDEEGSHSVMKNCSAAFRQAIELNPYDLKNYYHLARLDWAESRFMAIVTSLDAARSRGLDIDDDLQQFYQRAWKLVSKQEQKAHPMQYQPSRIDEDGVGSPSKPHAQKLLVPSTLPALPRLAALRLAMACYAVPCRGLRCAALSTGLLQYEYLYTHKCMSIFR